MMIWKVLRCIYDVQNDCDTLVLTVVGDMLSYLVQGLILGTIFLTLMLRYHSSYVISYACVFLLATI